MKYYKDSFWREKARFFVRFHHRLRSGGLRLRDGWLQILQTAFAACVAWFLAVLLLGLDRPTFAPIAAVIALGLAVSERGRRAVELTFGVAFGILIADFVVSILGVGAVQAAIVVALAMTVAAFLGRQEIGVKEAAISAMIIMITFRSSDSGFPLDRFLEALIGGGTALLINALLPVNPERMVTEAAYPVRDVRALARAALAVVQPGSAAPERLSRAIRGLARATESLGVYLETSGAPDDTRTFALEAAREATLLLEEYENLARNLAVNAVVDQIHSSAVDILRSTGMDRGTALRALSEVTGRTSAG